MDEVLAEIVVVNPRTRAQSEPMVALADTGAAFTVIPGGSGEFPWFWPTGAGPSETWVRLRWRSTETRRPAGCFGEPVDTNLLELAVLEQLGLAVDPVQRRLIPMEFLLY